MADEVNICGSSAIGQELPAAYRRLEPEKEAPVLLIAGSLTKQSISQTELLRRKGIPYSPLIRKRFLMKKRSLRRKDV